MPIKPRVIPALHCDVLGNHMLADWWHFLYSVTHPSCVGGAQLR